mmetsp:Transcript_9503/g.24200  ORF Transcript_9503/g.24200 Transcript_9503/m.24200 type:complete len:224 (+) Transcript_9503:496-1167(+)
MTGWQALPRHAELRRSRSSQPFTTIGNAMGASSRPAASISSIASTHAASLSSSLVAMRRTAASCRLTRELKWLQVCGGEGNRHSSRRPCRALRACWKRSIRSSKELRMSRVRRKGRSADRPRPRAAVLRPLRSVSEQKRRTDAASSTITTSSTSYVVLKYGIASMSDAPAWKNIAADWHSSRTSWAVRQAWRYLNQSIFADSRGKRRSPGPCPLPSAGNMHSS